VAENSGGVHCLKYGMTVNNVLGCEIVLMNGDVIRLGGKHLDPGGYDLLGVFVGSEGLLGVVTEVTVRILQKAAVSVPIIPAAPDLFSTITCCPMRRDRYSPITRATKSNPPPGAKGTIKRTRDG
jgi:glycolate oxidase